ncbi:ATP-dependent DNA ligase [Streptomyces platensis]|uniref:ATP-dependent DNA ligase n=1 Tax=Streptomyces platensis TaxID=58346 RepID=UPI0036B0DE34
MAFGDIAAAAERDLPGGGVLLDGELVVWHEGRLAFDRLQRRLNRTAATIAREIREAPAHFVAFDVLRLAGEDLMVQPYLRRRERLERFFAEERLGPPWVLCPITLDRAEAERWMEEWAAADVGLEGIVAKKLDQSYRPAARGWSKVRIRHTTEAVIGGVTGTLSRPGGECSGDGSMSPAAFATSAAAPR